MITLHAGRLPIKIHRAFLGLLCFLLLCQRAKEAAVLLFTLLMHESGHLLFAKFFHIHVDEIELTPFGGLIRMNGLDAAPPYQQLLTAFAGPLFSFLQCALFYVLTNWGSLPIHISQKFMRAGLLMLIFNLLPALPLDGGRMLRALLSFAPRNTVNAALTASGIVFGVLLIALSVWCALDGLFVLFPAFIGIYLIYAASCERRSAAIRYVSALIGRRLKIDSLSVLKAETLCVHEKMPVQRVIGHLSTGKYHIIHVLSADGQHRLGTVDDEALCAALLSDPAQTFGDITAGSHEKAFHA